MRRALTLLAAICLLSGVASTTARADACGDVLAGGSALSGGPRVVTRQLDGVPVNVLLPKDYKDPGHRYPVLYLLYGALADENTWLNATDIEGFTDAFSGKRDGEAAIVVMPRGHWMGVDVDWRDGTEAWETFYIDRLIPYIDHEFRTRPDRAHRAIAGQSSGGLSAFHIAARHPDLFAAVGGTSADYSYSSELPLGEGAFAVLERAVTACGGGDPTGAGIFGDPVRDAVWWHNAMPLDLARNLGGMSVFVASGTGVPCGDQRDIDDELDPWRVGAQAFYATEAFSRLQAEEFDATLIEAGIQPVIREYECGVHSFRYHERELRDFWPVMVESFASAAPREFDYRTADAPFGVWGWQFEPDASRAAEFLDVTNASSAGVTLTGSGRTTVTTASLFRPGEVVGLSGAIEDVAVAGRRGEITFHVDLGPAHALQQYTVEQRFAEQVAGGAYWKTASMTFGDVHVPNRTL